jgi:hypothetical protein
MLSTAIQDVIAAHRVGRTAWPLPRSKEIGKSKRGATTMEPDIRNQITREDLLEGIAALERGEPNAFGPSVYYDLLERGRRYPPKAVVGLAARRLLGRPLRPDEFSGGQESWAFRLLRERGFTVVDKEPMSSQLHLQNTSGSKIQNLLNTVTGDPAGNSAPAFGVLQRMKRERMYTR